MPEQPALELWAEHLDAVRIFEAMFTQWRIAPMGGRTGLDYCALPAVETRLGIGRLASRRAFAHLQVLEAEALTWWAARSASK